MCKTIPGTVRSLVTLASTYQMPEMLPSHCDNQTLSPFPSHCNNQTLSPFPSHCDKHFHLFPVIATITFTFSQSLQQSNTFTFSQSLRQSNTFTFSQSLRQTLSPFPSHCDNQTLSPLLCVCV